MCCCSRVSGAGVAGARADGVDGPAEVAAALPWAGTWGKRWMSEKTEEQALQPWPGNYKEFVVV